MKKKCKSFTCQFGRKISAMSVALLLALSMLFTMTPAVQAASVDNPTSITDSSMTSGKKATWDCVWFGSYPQTEIVLSGSEEESVLSIMNRILTDVAYQSVSSSIFKKISGATYDDNNDATVDGVTYHRMKKGDAKYSSDTYMNEGAIGSGFYNWTDETSWHYFRYDPIKWRVLSTDGEKALLLADEILDTGSYNEGATTGDGHTPTWATSTVRSWLNNYGKSSNLMETSYTTDGFLNRAFTPSEKAAIYTTDLDNSEETSGQSSTSDQIFLLSRSQVSGTLGASYGFADEEDVADEGRWTTPSTFALAMGIFRSSEEGESTWWLRTGMDLTNTSEVSHGELGKNIDSQNNHGMRPALYLDLTDSSVYSYAGTVCSDGTVKSVGGSVGATISSVKITGISQKIAAGKKITLKVEITPASASYAKIIWSSSNSKVATVNQNGVVTFKRKSGGKSVVITAKVVDENGTTLKKATFKLKSMKGIVKKITIKGAKSVKAGKSLKLKAKVKASKGANKKLVWTSSNTKYATVSSSGKVKTKKAGKGKKVKITAMATDGSGKKKTVTIKIKS